MLTSERASRDNTKEGNVLCYYILYYFVIYKYIYIYIYFYLSRPFTNHRTAGEGGEHFFNSSLPLPPASQTLRH